jgi:hypothetical protein
MTRTSLKVISCWPVNTQGRDLLDPYLSTMIYKGTQHNCRLEKKNKNPLKGEPGVDKYVNTV